MKVKVSLFDIKLRFVVTLDHIYTPDFMWGLYALWKANQSALCMEKYVLGVFVFPISTQCSLSLSLPHVVEWEYDTPFM